MKQFRNIMTYEEYKGEVNDQPDQTIPDQAMSIKEILKRFARGLPIEQFKPNYDNDDVTADDYLPDPRTMDLAERQEFAEMLQEEFYEISRKTSSPTPTEIVGLTKTENVE
jgi:hypothetical protein